MSVSETVIEYFSGMVGKTVTLGQMVKATGLGEKQIQSAIHNLRQRDQLAKTGLALEVITQGRVWAVTEASAPEAVPGKRTFREVGPAKDGSLIIEDDNGTLFRAVEL